MSAVGLKGRCCRSGPERAPRSEGHAERLGRRCEEFDSLTAIEAGSYELYGYVMITTRFYRHRVGNINLRECAAISVRTRRDCAVLKPRPTRVCSRAGGLTSDARRLPDSGERTAESALETRAATPRL